MFDINKISVKRRVSSVTSHTIEWLHLILPLHRLQHDINLLSDHVACYTTLRWVAPQFLLMRNYASIVSFKINIRSRESCLLTSKLFMLIFFYRMFILTEYLRFDITDNVITIVLINHLYE